MKPGRAGGRASASSASGAVLALLQLVELRLGPRGVRAFGNGLDQTPELAVDHLQLAALEAQVDPPALPTGRGAVR